SKGAAVYNETETYTSIYFGIGMEMIADQQVVDDIISTVNEMWAPSGVNIDNVAQNTLLGSGYPNPFDSHVNIEVNLTNDMILVVTDISGRKVFTKHIEANESMVRINTSEWDTGIYLYQLTGENPSAIKKMIKY
ncbi:MAG TPA: T9SS type A sorting domain-containing protein, partial [Bacteroidales bacterium]|nr:T9SS type A sorting domain-containing protein [Bacteroidales bacterium]